MGGRAGPGELLTAADLRRLLRVLEATVLARGPAEFRDRVQAALRQEFPVAGATLTLVPSTGSEVPPAGVTELILDTGLGVNGRLQFRSGPGQERLDAELLAVTLHLTHLLRLQLLAEPPLDGTHGLTRRELEVARCAGAGWGNRRIAAHLAISEETVKKHLSHSFAKLGVQTRTQLSLRLRDSASGPAQPL